MMELKNIEGQQSWFFFTNEVEIALTVQGGHMAPVTFYKNTHNFKPYYLNPWRNEGFKCDEPLLVPLRGDFFCLPFGAYTDSDGKALPLHGETATKNWEMISDYEDSNKVEVSLAMDMEFPEGHVDKKICLKKGQNVIYIEHVVSGVSGEFCYGHHQILSLPEEEHCMKIKNSPLKMGMVANRNCCAYIGEEYFSLNPGTIFEDPEKVETIWKNMPYTDLTRFPARKGFSDVAAFYCDTKESFPAWSTALVPSSGYLWYSLKDPEMLPQTLLWISNRGRHATPWSGRNVCLGMEEGCGYFADGLQASRDENCLNKKGISTTYKFDPEKPAIIKSIQGVVATPENFTELDKPEFKPGEIVFHSTGGVDVSVKVDWEFIVNNKTTL